MGDDNSGTNEVLYQPRSHLFPFRNKWHNVALWVGSLVSTITLVYSNEMYTRSGYDDAVIRYENGELKNEPDRRDYSLIGILTRDDGFEK